MAVRSLCAFKRILIGAIILTAVGAVEAVTLNWNPNPEPDIAGYRIYYGEADAVSTVAESETNSYTLTGLAPGRTYSFYVTAYNNSSLESEPSETLSYTTPTTPPPISGSSATFLITDSRTSGLWRGRYGSEGGIAPWGYFPAPSYLTVSGRNNNVWGWSPSTHLEPALQKTDSVDRIPMLWYDSAYFEFDLKFSDSLPRTVAFYFFDFSNIGRIQNLEFYDQVSGKLLAKSTISQFGEGIYSTWRLSGKIRVRISRVTGPNCVMSGILFGPPGDDLPETDNAAQFLSADAGTGGTWKGVFGNAGHSIARETPSLPAFVKLSIPGANSWIWNSNTSDPSALQRPNAAGRIASTWYSADRFSVSLELAGSDFHKCSFYFVDFDGSAREQTIEILDADSGALLDSTTLSEFQSGVWLTYNLKGHVVLQVIKEIGVNAVLSGLFFD